MFHFEPYARFSKNVQKKVEANISELVKAKKAKAKVK